jgi:hypothetical protein
MLPRGVLSGVDPVPAFPTGDSRSRVHDPGHFAYPIYAKAAMLRRDNLKRSADELRAQLAKAKEALLRGRCGCLTRRRTIFAPIERGFGPLEVTTKLDVKGLRS